jgi:hypothetical protein
MLTLAVTSLTTTRSGAGTKAGVVISDESARLGVVGTVKVCKVNEANDGF